MRDLILIGAIFVGLGLTFLHPFAGVILWTWFSIQNPHQEAYGFSRMLPLNLVIAIVTVSAWLLSTERKLPPNQFLVWMIFIFLAWMTFNSCFAAAPEWSWPYWDRTWKTFALGILICTLATNFVRISAITWAVVISLFYYGVKGGFFTIVTGGHFHVWGPENSQIGDNNTLALALLMGLPIANYLRTETANRQIARAIAVCMGLTFVAVVGSYSRGAFLGLFALGAIGLLKTQRRILYILAASIAGAGIFYFMPQGFWDRMDTIQSMSSDPSFQGRVLAWKVAYYYAVDHFPFGAGFYGPQLDSVFHVYFPKETSHAAHSIFFQVLGEHGFIGLAIYLAILGGAFAQSFRLIALCRSRQELAWVSRLASMIQISLFVFSVAGAALSMAYYDVFIICIALLVALRRVCEQHLQSRAQSRPPGAISSFEHVMGGQSASMDTQRAFE